MTLLNRRQRLAGRMRGSRGPAWIPLKGNRRPPRGASTSTSTTPPAVVDLEVDAPWRGGFLCGNGAGSPPWLQLFRINPAIDASHAHAKSLSRLARPKLRSGEFSRVCDRSIGRL